MAFLTKKRALVTGIASKLSIAYGIAEALHAQGCELALTYQNDKLKKRVLEFGAQWGVDESRCFELDASSDTSIDAAVDGLSAQWDGFDILVHAMAFAPREALAGDYVEATTRESFQVAHDISSYSFTALARAFRPLLRYGGALLTLSYLGAVSVVPNYNIMGLAKASLEANVRYMAVAMGKSNIRVNAISAGPIKTLAAAGIGDFKKMLQYNEKRTPLGRNVTTTEVGNTAAFLVSDLASGITGETIYVDCGFRITAMSTEEM